jgi:hypothetical protein
MKKLFLLLFMLAVLSCIAFAQVSGYIFSNTAGTYTEITGGTVLGTASVGGTTSPTTLDMEWYTATPMPFAFRFNGQPYTELAVSSDGYIVIGGTAMMGYTPISNTVASDGNIAVLGRDLEGNIAEGNLGEIRYETIGSAPDRIYVVQWKHFRRSDGVNEDYNFQVRLHETTDIIDFVYGQMLVNYTGTTHCQVGLRGATNADFNNRQVTTNWATSAAGAFNTMTATLSTTVYPASGTTYTFTLTVPTYPNPAIAVYPSEADWAFTGDMLRWTNNGGYPNSFDVYFGTSHSPSFIQNQTTRTYTPALAANTTYFWKIVPRNSYGPTPGCPIWSFKTPTTTQMAESFENPVFPPTGWANPGNWSNSDVNPYHLTTSARKSSNTTPTILSTPKVTITGSSTLSFWYKSGSLNDYGRLQIVTSPDRVTWTPKGSVLTLPNDQYLWLHQVTDLSSLAGSNLYLGFQSYSSSPTENASVYVDHVFGPEITAEAPDPVTQTAPDDLVTDMNTLPTFTWTAATIGGIPLGYKVYCDTNPNPTTLLATVPATEFTFTVSSQLLFGAQYYWKVVANNGTGDSTPNTVRSFTTWADPTVSTFPWSESFDGTTFAPMGWFNIKTAGTNSPGIWDRSTAGAHPACSPHSGAAMARYNSYSFAAGGKAILISIPLAVPNSINGTLKFWMFRDSGYATKTQESVNIYINTEPSISGASLLGTVHRYYGFTPVEATPNLWYQYSFAFTGSVACKYLIFEAVSENGNNIFLDDISVEAPPAPPVVTITNVSGSVKLNWSAVTGANSYKVYASDDPETDFPDDWTLLTDPPISVPPFIYTGTECFKFFKVTADTEAP